MFAVAAALALTLTELPAVRWTPSPMVTVASAVA